MESKALERPRHTMAAAIPPETAPLMPPPSIAKARVALSFAARLAGVDCE